MNIEDDKINNALNTIVTYISHCAVTDITKPRKIGLSFMQEQNNVLHPSRKVYSKIHIC